MYMLLVKEDRFFPVLLTIDILLCKYKVYNMMVSFMYILKWVPQ